MKFITSWKTVGCFAGISLASLLAGCSHQPLSASDCGRHATGGSGLLGLIAAAGAFDREARPDCRPSGYAVVTSAPYIPPNEVWMPPDPAPLADNSPRFLVPGGGGTLMEIGGGSQQLLVPAGGGSFLEMP
jgi:hypothetical protein